MTTFAESLDSLWSVQKYDAQIVREQERIAKASREQVHEQSKTDAARVVLETERESLRKLKQQHKELEGELQRLDARVKQLEAQGTEKGTEAAAKQRTKIDELEMQGLESLSQISEQELVLERAEAELSQRDEALLSTSNSTKSVIEAAQELIDKLAAERTEAARVVVPELLAVYNEVHARHPGKAITRLEGEFCGSCQSELRQQLLVQIKARAELIRCPNCLRILDV